MLDLNVPPGFGPLLAAQIRHQDALLGLPNVVGVGIGLKEEEGAVTSQRCITVLVRAKVPHGSLSDEELVPTRIGITPLDVIEVGEILAGEAWAAAWTGQGEGPRPRPGSRRRHGLQQRIRPAVGGCSLGCGDNVAGTMGTACFDAADVPGIPDRYYALSNASVLASGDRATVGDRVLQPGSLDGGREPDDVLGTLSRFIPIRFISDHNVPCNYVDAAIAEVPFCLMERQIYWIGRLTGRNDAPTVGELVQKTGRSSDYTTGRVRFVNATVDVRYGAGRIARFHRQLVTTAMGAPGDSGSVVADLDGRGVGLLFAGSDSLSVMNHLHWVESLLGIRTSGR